MDDSPEYSYSGNDFNQPHSIHTAVTTQPTNQNAEDYPGARRPIPVSTIDWQTTNNAQFIPINGLDFLIGVDNIIIQQTVELGDMMTTIESENRYVLKVPGGETLYMANEFSTPFTRLMCGAKRPFNMTLTDHSRQQALTLTRRTAFSMCCLPCIVQEIHVSIPPGEHLGSIQQEWTLCSPLFLVKNYNDDVMFVIEGPKKNMCCGKMEAEFKILSGDNLTELGNIMHGWDIQSTNFNMVVTFPSEASDPKVKALLIGAAFLIEYVYFVSAKSTRCLSCCC